MSKYDVLREIAEEGGSVRQILKEFRGRGYKTGDKKALSIIREVRAQIKSPEDRETVLKELSRDKTKSQKTIIEELRGKGFKIDDKKARNIIRETRGEDTQLITEREEAIKELSEDSYNTFRDVGRKLRAKGFKIGDKALLEKYREIRLCNKIKSLKESVEAGKMARSTADRIEGEFRKYFMQGRADKLEDIYGRLYTRYGDPIFIETDPKNID